ncbi:MAG TPA: glycosyltransferase family 87 protein [Candidatus Sulfotelmatobacter sp.]|nr:glycosyltransferase family 87 protein [Candidatus Sulfotelmatobacter sp.]
MWIWVQAIAIPHQHAEADATGAPRGNLSDLYPRWLGARELLLHGRDPYRDDITREIQIGYYGRVLDPSRPHDPKDQQAFAYPVYVVLMLAPTVKLPFAIVRSWVFWLFTLLTAMSVPLWLYTLEWRISTSAKIAWTLLTLSSFPAVQGAKLQQLTVLVAAIIAAAMSAVAQRRLGLAGVLLAMATIKPQLVVLLTLWLGVWVISQWKERQWLFWSFVITIALMVAAGELLLPGWIREFRGAMSSYYTYTGGGTSVLDVLLTKTIGRMGSVVMVALLSWFAWDKRRTAETTAEFWWMFCFAMATTLLVIPTFAPYNQILLLPACMIFLRAFRNQWQSGPLRRFFVAVTASSVFWSYPAAAGLAIALLFLPAVTVQQFWRLPFYPSFAIPVMIYATLLAARKDFCSLSDNLHPDLPILQPNAAAE